MKKLLLTILFCLLTVTAHAATYYVSPSGNDSLDGLSTGNAWKTITKVNGATLVAGDSVLFLRGGIWTTTALVPKSGSSGSPIVYGAYGSGSLPVIPGVDASSKSYVTVNNLEINGGTTTAALLNNTNHAIFNGCNIYSSGTAWDATVLIKGGSTYNQFNGNSISLTVAASGNVIDQRDNSSHTLFYNNTVTTKGAHAALSIEGGVNADGTIGSGTSNYNVISKNTFVGSYSAGALINLDTNGNYNIIEGNTLTGDGTLSSYCGVNTSARHEDMFKLLGTGNIVRNNIIKGYPCANSLGITMETYTYTNGSSYTNNAISNHVYNNVITNVGVGGVSPYLGTNGAGVVHDNYFKNNAFFANGGTYLNFNINGSGDGSWATDSLNTQMKVQVSGSVYSNYFQNNLIYSPASTGVMWVNNAYYTVAQAQSWNSTLYAGNLQTDPQVDASLHPLTGSPLVDAGTYLTVASGSGSSSTSLTVADAGYFTDGAGLTAGDSIMVGSTPATIASISGNTITLTSPISWANGAYVNMAYNGSAPDIGAYEYVTPSQVAVKVGTSSGAWSTVATTTGSTFPASDGSTNGARNGAWAPIFASYDGTNLTPCTGSAGRIVFDSTGTYPAAGACEFAIDTSTTAGGGSSGTTSSLLTFNTSGGGAAGTTFNGGSAVTVDYHTVGAQASNANLTTYAGIAPSANAQTLLGHTFAQMLSDLGAQSSLGLLAGTLTNGKLCTYTSTGTLLSCTTAPPATQTCSAGNHISAFDPSTGNFTCSADATSGGSTDTNAVHVNTAGEIAGVTSKATPVSGDLLLIEDSAATNAKKKVTVGSLPFQASLGYTPVANTVTVNGHALSSNVTVTTTDLSLNNVTNDAQTKAAIVPNTVPTAGQIHVGNAGGTAFASVSMSGDCTLASTGAITCTKLNGTTTTALATTAPGTGVTTALALNVGSAGAMSTLLATGTATLGTSAIASGACATAVTVAGTGIATTDVVDWGFNGDPTAVTGYTPSTNGMLTIIAYPTSGNVNFRVCNNTSASVTPGAITLNWRVRR